MSRSKSSDTRDNSVSIRWPLGGESNHIDGLVNDRIFMAVKENGGDVMPFVR